MPFLFTSESVCQGHPDKVADQISDAILDACLEQDPNSRVACETMLARNRVHIAGEITSNATVDYEKIAREVIKDVGYTDPNAVFSDKNCVIETTISQQSAEISSCVTSSTDKEDALGAGDQGLMFGFACRDSEELLPLPIAMAHRLVQALEKTQNETRKIGPDGKVQVTIEYDGQTPKRIDTILISVQHKESVSKDELAAILMQLIKEVVPDKFLDNKTKYHFNPSGLFTVGGPEADCGLTGRKIIVDTYGGYSRHGGGAFSGKDCSKVDRSAAYMARYIAKNIVAAGFADICELQIAYGIGMAHPISIHIDTRGTGTISDRALVEMVSRTFNLTPDGIIETLDLKKPIYRQTSHGGHFGRSLPGMTWEKLNYTKELLAYFAKESKNLNLKNKEFHSTNLQ